MCGRSFRQANPRSGFWKGHNGRALFLEPLLAKAQIIRQHARVGVHVQRRQGVDPTVPCVVPLPTVARNEASPGSALSRAIWLFEFASHLFEIIGRIARHLPAGRVLVGLGRSRRDHLVRRQPVINFFLQPLRHRKDGGWDHHRPALLAFRPELQVDGVDLRFLGIVAPHRPDLGGEKIQALRIGISIALGAPPLNQLGLVAPIDQDAGDPHPPPAPPAPPYRVPQLAVEGVPEIRFIDAVIRPIADHGIAQSPGADAVGIRVDAPADPFALYVVLANVGAGGDKQDVVGDFAEVFRAPRPRDERRFREAAR